MTSLLSRLQSATGPSRELDAEIALANGWTQLCLYGNADGPRHWISPTCSVLSEPPRYSESIDAALTDVPEGMAWVIAAYKNHSPLIPPYSAGLFTLKGELKAEGESHATPAIAIRIAIERAKEDSKP